MHSKLLTLCGEKSEKIAKALCEEIHNFRAVPYANGASEANILVAHGINVIEYGSPVSDQYYDVTEKTKEDVIFDNRLFNVYIFSLPRSGSSMMTHIVELLGVNVVYTSEEEKKRKNMDERYKKRLGEYHPNRHGFYEITQDMIKNYIRMLSSPYSGCKMIIPVQRHRWDVVKMNPMKIIQMWRDPEEIRQSQEAFYSKKSDDAFIRTALVEQEIIVKKQLGEENYLPIEYQDVLANPRKEIEKIAKFINSPNSIEEAVQSVRPKENRFKKEELEKGI